MSTTKIDEWMPQYEVSARYSILIRASLEKTFSALASASFSNLSIVRVLMRLRGYRLDPTSESTLSKPGCQYGAFLELAIVPQQEVLLGITGRFWRPDGGIVRDLRAEDFLRFNRPGYSKAVWNFFLAPVEGGTQLSTETRVQTFGRSATLKFRLYWLVVGPFSGLMRKSMLHEVKKIAEQIGD